MMLAIILNISCDFLRDLESNYGLVKISFKGASKITSCSEQSFKQDLISMRR